MATAVEKLARAWGTPAGFAGWLAAVNHRAIGTRYMVTAFVFFLLAGVQALIMRLQLAVSDLQILSPEAYNQFFTMHGTTMMFFFLVPFLEGLGIYLVPLMIGARDMAFPRLNAFGYWIYLVAGVVLYWAFFTGTAPHSGWFNYVPLTGRGFSPGVNIDYFVTMIALLEVAALVAAVELIVTIFMQRAPGMSLNRMPLFVWAVLVMAFMIIFAMPPLVIASLLLGLDRFIGTHFYNPAAGGEPLLWQHLFWFFGHPDVYIMLVPALGIISAIVPVFARRRIAAYTVLVVTIVAIGFISFGLWVHHMYTTGLPLMGMNFFVAASMLITIPSGIQIFSWIVTMWRGRLTIRTPLLFAIGFIVLFILGGITGVMIAAAPFDWQVHDTFFIVAHFHYVLIGGVVFPIFAAIHFWFPKITGRMLDDRVGRWSFWLVFAGFNATFLPMHILGLEGMPRRIYTYLPDLGWDGLNLFVTAGAFLMGLGVAVFVWNMVVALLLGDRAGDNPWDADTLEWATTSPPPAYNFQYMPVVRSLTPLWDGESPVGGTPAPREPWQGELADPPEGRRATPSTTVLEAAIDHQLLLPPPSVWPLWAALAVGITFVGAIVDPVLVLPGTGLILVTLLGWLWPPRHDSALGAEPAPGVLPLVPRGRSTVWAGMALFIVIEAAGIASLVVSYFYLRVHTAVWPPPGVPLPELWLPGAGLALLLLSVVPAELARRRFLAHDAAGFRRLVLPALGLVLAYLALTIADLASTPVLWTSHAYGSLLWTLNGYQVLHVAGLVVFGGVVWVLVGRQRLTGRRATVIDALTLYWFFAAASSALVAATLYVTPHLA